MRDAGAAARCVQQFETKSIKELFVKSLFEKETLGDHSWFKKVANDETESLYVFLKKALALWSQSQRIYRLA